MATAMLVICSFIMLSVAFIILGRSYLITEYREKMDRNADEVSRTASALSVDGNVSSWNLRLVITSISTSSGNHIFITNPEGTIVLCSDREYYCEHMGQQMSRNVMELLQSEGGIDQLSNLDGFYSGTRFVVAKPIDDPSGNRLGYFFVSSDTTNIVGAYRTFLWVSMAMVCAVVLLALMLSLFYSKKMSEPLDEIALASRRFAHGDFSVRVENKGQRTDELGTLIDSFNEMADSYLKTDMVSRAIVQKEGITENDDIYKNAVKSVLANYNANSLDDLVSQGTVPQVAADYMVSYSEAEAVIEKYSVAAVADATDSSAASTES